MTFGDYVLLCRTADRPGKLAAISDAVRSHGGDVRDAQSFGDDATGAFFVRMQVRLADSRADALRKNIAEIGDMLPGAACLHATAQRPRLVIAVSKFDHCLVDLLHRHRVGAIGGDIAAVISNHDTTRPLVEWHDIPFIHLPVTQETKFEQQAAFQRAVSDAGADLVVLARYMQVLSNELCDAWAGKCINIHHSFLPSFKGAKPYQRAFERGVKLIGATAHYVTPDLDEGPIIEQDVRRVTHATSAADMIAIGRETEASVLARAVRWHCEHRVMLNGSKTVILG